MMMMVVMMPDNDDHDAYDDVDGDYDIEALKKLDDPNQGCFLQIIFYFPKQQILKIKFQAGTFTI